MAIDSQLSATAGQTVNFTVRARDRYGNAITTGGDPFAVRASGGASCTVLDNSDGSYTCMYTNPCVGEASVTVVLGAIPVGRGSYPVVVSPGMFPLLVAITLCLTSALAAVSASNSTVSGPGLQTATAGAAAYVTVTPRDEYRNRTRVDPAACSLLLTGPTTVTGHIERVENDGSLVASYVPSLAGEYSLSVLLNGQAVGGCPCNVQVQPGILLS